VRKVNLVLTDAARTWLATRGFDKHFGARPLVRLIQTEIKDALADELLFGCIEKGGSVVVDVNDDKLAFEYANAVT
jgi:ATP-dependent Clp protease ATP-binding subunit ClpA